MAVDVVADGHDQLLQVLEGTAPDSVFRQIAKEAFDHIGPRGRGRREVHMEALVSLQPPFDTFVFVRSVVVADDMDLLIGGHGLVDHAQEL